MGRRQQGGGGPETLERHVDADRELPQGDRECGEHVDPGGAVENAEEDREVGGEQQRDADEPDGRQDAWHQAGAVHDVAHAARVYDRRQALREQERIVVDGAQGAGSSWSARICRLVSDTTTPRALTCRNTGAIACPRGDLGTVKWEPSHQRPSRWGRGAVCAASWTWSERSAAVGQDHRSAGAVGSSPTTRRVRSPRSLDRGRSAGGSRATSSGRAPGRPWPPAGSPRRPRTTAAASWVALGHCPAVS